MLAPDHDCFDLQTRAALVSAWPVLHVFTATEDALLEARERAEDALGPLAQADEIAPWDEEDDEEPWELRIALPGLRGADWNRLSAVLADFSPILVPGQSPGITNAIDGQQRDADVLEAGGLTAHLWFNADDGGVVGPELDSLTSLDVSHLASPLVLAMQAHGVNLPLFSDQGADTLEAVIDRSSGRVGIRGFIPAEYVDPLDGDALMATREGLVGALGDLIRGQASAPLALAPDLLWDTRMGLGFVVWTLQPSQPILPSDTLFAEGLTPSPDALGALLRGARGLCDHFELQVWTDEHELTVMEVAAQLPIEELGFVGGPPRWILTDEGPRFALVWLVDPTLDAAVLGLALLKLSTLDEVRGARLVPSQLARTGDAWQQCDPTWWVRGSRCFVRLRDGLPDRDRWMPGEERKRSEQDAKVEAALGLALLRREDLPRLEAHEDGLLRPVRIGDRDAAEVRFGSGTTPSPDELERLFDALATVRSPHLASVHLACLRRSGVAVQLAYLPAS